MRALRSMEELSSLYRAASPRSEELVKWAGKWIPGGASRDSVSRKPYPPIITRGDLQYVYDIDGTKFIDYCLNLGPILLGHCFEPIRQAVQSQLENGCGFGAPAELEAKVAQRVCEAYPSVERVRFLSTGTEAVMFLIRLARAFTGRPKIVKFIGAYHGSYDGVQLSVRPVAVGSQWQGAPETEGLCPGIAAETLAVPYNDLSALRNCLDAHRGQVALVLMDLSMNACGLITPKTGFLEGVLELTHGSGALFGCDEVVTGFRYGLGGAAGLYGVTPDLVAFGKVLGGGLPIGAVAGRADFMSLFESLDGKGARVGQSGTFAANPLTMAAANAFLEYVMTRPEGYERVSALTEGIRERLREVARKHRIPAAVTGVASAFQIHTGIEENVDHETFSKSDLGFRECLFLHLALKGIFAPGALGTFFVSWSHTSEDADALVDAVDEFFSEAS